MSNNNSVKKEIEKSWSLIDFAKAHGKMQLGSFTTVDEDGTKRDFKSCIFTGKDSNRVFVNFSSRLGELNKNEIASQVAELQVVKLVDGGYILCHKGVNSWEDIDLGI